MCVVFVVVVVVVWEEVLFVCRLLFLFVGILCVVVCFCC